MSCTEVHAGAAGTAGDRASPPAHWHTPARLPPPPAPPTPPPGHWGARTSRQPQPPARQPHSSSALQRSSAELHRMGCMMPSPRTPPHPPRVLAGAGRRHGAPATPTPKMACPNFLPPLAQFGWGVELTPTFRPTRIAVCAHASRSSGGARTPPACTRLHAAARACVLLRRCLLTPQRCVFWLCALTAVAFAAPHTQTPY